LGMIGTVVIPEFGPQSTVILTVGMVTLVLIFSRYSMR